MNKQDKINTLIEWIKEGNIALNKVTSNRLKLVQMDADDEILALNSQQYKTELDTLNWCYDKLRTLLGYMVNDIQFKDLFPKGNEDKTVNFML